MTGSSRDVLEKSNKKLVKHQLQLKYDLKSIIASHDISFIIFPGYKFWQELAE